MNPNEKIIRFATGAQCAQLSGMVAVALAKKFDGVLSFPQAQIAITDKDQFAVNELAEKFANEIFAIPIDPWIHEKTKISYFYKTCFKDNKWKNPNWEQVTAPTSDDNLKHLEFIFSKMTVQEAFSAYSEYFGKDKAFDGIIKDINPESIHPRPGKDYIMLHVGGDEPDLQNKSYGTGLSEGLIFMTPLEGIISAFRYRFETGKMYDLLGNTRLAALDHDCRTICMYGSVDGIFYLDKNLRGYRRPQHSLRQVKLF